MLGHILIVNHDAEQAVNARNLLKDHARLIHTVKKPDRIPALMAANRYNVVLLDENVLEKDDLESYHWIQHIRLADSNTLIIVTSRLNSYSRVVGAIKAGAHDVLPVPFSSDLADLIFYISEQNPDQASTKSGSAMGESSSSASQASIPAGLSSNLETDQTEGFVGASAAMRQVWTQIDKVAGTEANVLILGENGTGKELVARALHQKSGRRSGPFVPVDVGSVSGSLFESELFGHKRGAFTDAVHDRLGRFETAASGTLFLDEIGNLPTSLQAKLLTVLQQRTLTPLGSNDQIPIDVRLVCATNQPLYEAVHEGYFRQDLLYRINTVEIYLPPLRERKEDIGLLAHYFLSKSAAKYNPNVTKIAPATLRKMEKYKWPGNIRELKHMVERAVIMTENEALSPEDFQFKSTISPAAHSLVFETLHLESVEKQIIQTAMNKHGGIVTQAANELGLTRTTLYRRLEKHGL